MFNRLFSHGSLVSATEARSTCVRAFRVELQFGSVVFLWKRGKPENPETEMLLEQGENQQQTNRHRTPGAGIEPGPGTLKVGERSHHYAILAPLFWL